jgi:hypothetical protein
VPAESVAVTVPERLARNASRSSPAHQRRGRAARR